MCHLQFPTDVMHISYQKVTENDQNRHQNNQNRLILFGFLRCYLFYCIDCQWIKVFVAMWEQYFFLGDDHKLM